MPCPHEHAAMRTQKMSELAHNLADTSDQHSQKLITQALVLEAKQMIHEIQEPFDTLVDQVVAGYTIASSLSLLEIGVFDAVPPTESITAKDLSSICEADEELIVRLMRQLTCVNIFTEVKLREWSHNKNSIILSTHTNDYGETFYKVCFEEMLPSMIQFYRYLREYGNKDVHTYTATPHSWHNDMVGKNFWEVLDSTPERIEVFNKCLQQWGALHPVVALFPFNDMLRAGNSQDRPLLVDIGGGNGQALVEFRKGCPDLQGELVLQDRPEVIANISADDLPGITKMGHDFFTAQPVTQAQVYYIRRVMHDWQDQEAAKIMKAIMPAMAADSRILLADMIIPEFVTLKDAGAVWLDVMLMAIGGKERTIRDWTKLAELTGLKLVKIWQEPDTFGTLCVVEYMLDDSKDNDKVLKDIAAELANGAGPGDHSKQEVNGVSDKNAITNGEDAPLLNGITSLEINGETCLNGENEMMKSPKRSVEVGG